MESNNQSGNGNYRGFKPRTNAGNANHHGAKGKLFCNYCHGETHTKEKCFYLNGYPDWHPLFGTKPDLSKMPKNKGKGKSLHAVNSVTVPGVANSGFVNSPFTQEQYQQLLTMLSNSNSGHTGSIDSASPLETLEAHLAGKHCTVSTCLANHVCLVSTKLTSHDWILDTGASDHITNCFSYLFDPVPITSTIHLPNGKTSSITHKGTVLLSDNLVLHNVYFVPNFHFNLISGSKFTTDNKCCLVFSTNTCFIQDPLQQKLKEIGKLNGGLSKLETSASISSASLRTITCNSSSISTCTKLVDNVHSHSVPPSFSNVYLWHQRLGHVPVVSMRHIDFLSSKFNLNSCNSFQCDVCHFARQTRQPFPLSSSNSTSMFDFLYCDVWGPYKHPTYDGCTSFLTIVDDHTRATWTFLLK